MNEIDPIERIERYLADKMDPQEKAAMERDMQRDPQWNQEVAAYRRIFEGLRALRANVFVERLKSWEKEGSYGVEPDSRPGLVEESRWLGTSPWYGRVAAAVLFLLLPLGALIYVFNRPQPSAGELFAQYFAPAPNVVAHTLRSESGITALERERILAMQAYDRGDFETACSELLAFMESHPEDQRMSFHLGMAFLATHRAQEAQRIFDTLRALPDPYYSSELPWYTALALLEQGQTSACRNILSTITADTLWRHREKAEQLLLALD
jgi:hypothetical protein